MKYFYPLLVAATAMVFACTPSSLEPEEAPVADDARTTIAYSLNTVDTRVSYETGEYALASGDKLRITGSTRTDIEGELSYNAGSGNWTGELSYLTSEGAPEENVTGMVATLIHAANADYSKYAHAVVASDQADQLQYAVENYSLFTADYTYGETDLLLSQNASFLDVNVTFTFINNVVQMSEGATYVDIVISGETVTGSTQIVQDGVVCTAQFLAVVPAGQDVKDIKIQICDREITFGNSATLLASKKYTVTRTIEFKPQLGDPFWSDGTYGRLTHPDGVQIVGVIVYANRNSADSDEQALDNAITESENGGGHALVMALKNANPTPGTGVQWGTITNNPHTTAVGSPQVIRTNLGLMSGFSNSGTQYSNNCNAAILAKEFENGTNYNGTTTGWFLPSIGQWFYSIIAFGEADPIEEWTDNDGNNYLANGNWNSLIRVKKQSTNSDNLLVKKLNDRLELLASQFGISYDSFGISSSHGFSDNYWTSSENAKDKAIRMNLGSVEKDKQNNQLFYSTIKTKPESKTATYSWHEEFIMKVRPFLAF